MLLSNLPTSCVVYVSTQAMRRSVALLVCIQQALNSYGMNPTWNPMMLMAVHRSAMILVILVVDHCFLLFTTSMWVWSESPCYCRCATRLHISDTAHFLGCPVAPCPIEIPLNPFLWVVKRSMKNVRTV